MSLPTPLAAPDPIRPRYRLVRSVSTGPGPRVLDSAQRRVVDHPGGPLLVLAGPGTGKTTCIVESIVHRVRERGVDPAQVLVLTFSRKAAAELRSRITARLGGATREPLALTFHSFAYGLVRREALRAGSPVPRLLSGPEQDLEIRRLLAGEAEDGGRYWPPRLRAALRTRGFAEEVRDLLLRSTERGLDADGLHRLAAAVGREDWAAVAGFLRRYTERFAVDALVPALDYAALIGRAADLLVEEAGAMLPQPARDQVFVDEYQDTDPAQERLLTALAGGGRDLVAVGDPDQSIYAFRGAEIRNVLDFPERFRTVDGQPAPVVALRTCRRSGAALLAGSRRVAERLPTGWPSRAHRDLLPAPGLPAGSITVRLAASRASEAALVADELRRAHLLEGVPWSGMAVLVRSAGRSLPVLRRALATAGVPNAVAGDETPLAGDPAVRPLLLVLRCACNADALTEEAAVELVSGPLGGLDAVGLRRLRRALGADLVARDPTVREPAPVRGALRDPAGWEALRPPLRSPIENVARLLMLATEAVRDGGSAEDALWAVWAATGLAERWERTSATGGPAAATADRALDAVLALFDAAARFADRLPGASPELFLDDLLHREIPGDTLAEQAAAGDTVRLLTAHRAKGLEWDVVVLAGVQEGSWPDLRPRGSLLGSEALVELLAGRDPARPGARAVLLAEERRLFYVACTRARTRLIVTAVGGEEEDVDQRPSRFLDELLPGHSPAADPSPRPLTLPALVSELRSVVTDCRRAPPLRRAAAAQLAKLADAGVRGAAPQEWHALTPVSTLEPVYVPEVPIRVSPSLVQSVQQCPLRWLLERAASGGGPAGPSQVVGSVVHALAALVTDPVAAQEVELIRRLDEVWASMDLGSPWYTRAQREQAGVELRKFLAWHTGNDRQLVAVEEPFEVSAASAVLAGRVDRLERDADGRGVVVDLKTGSSKPNDAELRHQPQLGAYQLAVALGAFAGRGLVTPGGAELVQLGKCSHKAAAHRQRQPPLSEAEDPRWVENLLTSVTSEMRGPRFRVTANECCRTCAARTCCPLQPEGARGDG